MKEGIELSKIIEVNNLSFDFADARVFQDISLHVEKGEFIGLSGPNGAGKSTLLKLILGELRPLSGEVNMFGKNINGFDHWEKIGYISQKMEDLNASFPASVIEVVELNLYRSIGLFKPIGKKHRKRAMEALELVGAVHLANKRIGELSGGQQQRVFLARALVNNPELLIMDEATSGIDAHSQDLFYDLLHKLMKDMNITILMVSHDMQRIHDNVDRLYYLTDLGMDHYDLHDKEEHDRLNYIIHGQNYFEWQNGKRA